MMSYFLVAHWVMRREFRHGMYLCIVPLEGGETGAFIHWLPPPTVGGLPLGKSNFPELLSMLVQLRGISWLWRNALLVLEVRFWKHPLNSPSEFIWLVHTDICYGQLYIHDPWNWDCLLGCEFLHFFSFFISLWLWRCFDALGQVPGSWHPYERDRWVPKKKGTLGQQFYNVFSSLGNNLSRARCWCFQIRWRKASTSDFWGPWLHLGGILMAKLVQGMLSDIALGLWTLGLAYPSR